MDIQNALLQAQRARRENILKGFSNIEDVKEDLIQKSEQDSELNPFEEFEKSEEDEFEKGGKPAVAGEIRTWGGKKYKKQLNGKWLEVSEYGLTKKEHEGEIKNLQKTEENKGNEISDRRRAQDEQEKQHKASSKLSDKEHSDEEVGIKKQEEASYEEFDKLTFESLKTTDPIFKAIHKFHVSLRNEFRSMKEAYAGYDATEGLVKDMPAKLDKFKDELIKNDMLTSAVLRNIQLIKKEIANVKEHKKEEKERHEKENNSNDIQKGEISDSVNYGDSIKVKKKGSEIKEQVNNVVLPELNSKLLKLEESADEILVDCGKAPTMPSSNFYYGSLGVEVPFKVYNWDESQYCDKSNGITTSLSSEDAMMKASKLNYPASKEQAENRQKYNQIIRDMISVAADIKTCEVLKSLKDNDEFSLTTRQVVSFKF